MKTLLVTGGCGFIGSNFIRYLFEETSFSGTIINVDKLTYAGNPESLEDIAQTYDDRYRFLKSDICNLDAMAAIMEDNPIDAICHFAAESHVDRSIVSPEAFIDTNIKGTFNLLEAARRKSSNFVRFHHVSTDEVYGTLGNTGFFTEQTAYSPNSPYSASKASSDHLVRAYHETYGLDITISNCSNNYGPYQFPEKLIPLMILNALAGKPLPVYGEGKNVRDWLYVRDHCRAVWMILQNGNSGETYNVGGECELENCDIVQRICRLIDKTGKSVYTGQSTTELIRFVKDRPGHDFRYAIDCSKLKKQLGWRPEESFNSALEKCVTWYSENSSWIERIQSGEYLNWIDTHYGSK